ncbi:dihydrodipicolinate synthase [Pleurostoma richardsiae]|uniref:Dihydrodipicolinate synthase n=1 Tax=Pleurostoma richardsiae TaxID=41990 RepID=A0AA38RTR9_9PEZI|nr:dihydrodipicolinate synthase [Pleurostoma richardsiae]
MTVSNHTSRRTTERALVPGIYIPTVAFFDPDTEDLDLDATARHAVRLVSCGAAGLAVQGSNGEAVHLTRDERRLVVETTRSALRDAGFESTPLLVGCGAQSTRETLALCREAHKAGGDFALVLPPSYYGGLFARETVLEFFRDVADQSPIPLVIYNYPGATPSVDLSSDVIISLGSHPNIVGCKFTCGNTGKLARVAAAFRGKGKGEFLCFAGSADFTLPALAAGGAGVIGGVANVAPKACVKLFDLYQSGAQKETRSLQEVVGRGDWAAIQSGVIGVKVALQEYFGYGAWARKPLPRPSGAERQAIVDGFRELVELEKTL